MNRLNLSQDTRLKLQEARKALETSIRECKGLMRQPHTSGSGASTAQSNLPGLRRQATLLYITIAATNRREHCKTAPELMEALQKRASSPYLSPVEKLILAAQAPAPTAPAVAPVGDSVAA